ncbi:universal stress protein [Actinomycetospora chlora]|uniref:Universal stress protein n=1 Tax=Actinomycetospora chlora TaxID=663608 RepID=A0ABP9ALL9_9PSEU
MSRPVPAPADPVVVGVDDGLLRRRVLDRAVAEARRRAAPLHLVHTHGPETPLAPWQDDAGRRAGSYLARTAPDLDVTLDCRAGDTTDVLVGACGPGSLLILGDRHRRLASEAGQTTARAIEAAPCPVVVIPEYRGPTPPGTVVRRAVVVGVDDGPAAASVVAYALRAAAGHDARLEAVRVIVPATGREAADVPPAEVDRAHRELDALVDAARRHGPAVPVETSVVVDRPARVLLERAEGAEELVVGHRRHADPTLRGPGSTARSVLLGMTSPVTVLGPRGRDGAPVTVAAEDAR